MQSLRHGLIIIVALGAPFFVMEVIRQVFGWPEQLANDPSLEKWWPTPEKWWESIVLFVYAVVLSAYAVYVVCYTISLMRD